MRLLFSDLHYPLKTKQVSLNLVFYRILLLHKHLAEIMKKATPEVKTITKSYKDKAIGFFRDLVPIVALLSLTFAVIATFNARKIIQNISTRHVGDFPYNIENINDLLESSKKSALVVCDFPAYGIYSNPNEFKRYRRSIEKLSNEDKVAVTLVTYSPEMRMKKFLDQFDIIDTIQLKDSIKFQDYRKKEKDKIERFEKQFCTSSLHTFEDLFWEFEIQCNEVEKRILQNEAEGNVIFEVNEEILNIYFWLVDGKKSVFSFSIISPKKCLFHLTTLR